MTFFAKFSRPVLRPLVSVGALTLLGLSGCTQVYDDTKGWGNDVEAWFRRDVLKPIAAEMRGDEEQHAPQAEPALAASPPASTREPAPMKPTPTPETASSDKASEGTPQPTIVASNAPAVPVVTSDKTAAGHGGKASAGNGGSADTNLYPQTAGKAPQSSAAEKSKNPEVEHKAQQHAASVPSSMALHLSSNKTEAAAKQEWGQLKSAFPQLLGGLSLDIERTDLGKKGVFYRVLAGSFADKPAAAQICSQLKKKQQYCAVMRAPKAKG